MPVAALHVIHCVSAIVSGWIPNMPVSGFIASIIASMIVTV